MLKKFQINIKNKKEISILVLLIFITAIFTTYYNIQQQKIKNNYNGLINNIYFKKTTNHFLDKLEPKFKKIRHQITVGETFDSILSQYFVDKKEIQILKKKLYSMGFKNFKRTPIKPKFQNLRDLLVPFYFRYNHNLSKFIYGDGQIRFTIQKK